MKKALLISLCWLQWAGLQAQTAVCTSFWKNGAPVTGTTISVALHAPGELPDTLSADGVNCMPLPDTTLASYPAGSTLTYSGFRDGDDLNGVNILDILNIVNHILGLYPLASPYGYFAADVPSVVGSPFGPALNYDGAKKAFTQGITGAANGLSPDESCVVVCTFGSSTWSQHLFGFGNVFSSSLADYGRGVGVEGGNLFVWGASASNGKKLTATLPPLNTPCVIAVRFAVDGAVYVNGQKVASGDMSHSWSYYLSTGCAVGAVESVELAKFTGLVGPRRWWRRGLRDNELQALSINPQLIYRQQPRQSFPTIGAGPTFKSAWTVNANSVLQGSLAA